MLAIATLGRPGFRITTREGNLIHALHTTPRQRKARGWFTDPHVRERSET